MDDGGMRIDGSGSGKHLRGMNAVSITLEPDAYAHLSAARTTENESWSEVVRRAVWPPKSTPHRGKEIVEFLRSRKEFIDEAALERIEAADRNDAPPANPWIES
jgi:hypothetical protein